MKRKVTFLPDGKSVQLIRPESVLRAASRVGVKINQRCAGKAACLTCKVKVEGNQGVSAPNAKERLKLGPLLDQGVRLACQTMVQADATIHVPEDPLKALIRAKLAKMEGDDDGADWD